MARVLASRVNLRVVVAGAGVVGATAALALAKAGASVTLVDPAPTSANASGVAAGMLAPVFETVFDPHPAHYPILMEARDCWPSFTGELGVAIERVGALAVTFDVGTLELWRAELSTLGVAAQEWSGAELARERPDLASGLMGLAIEDDWRIEPGPSLRRILAEAERLKVQRKAVAVLSFDNGLVHLSDATTLDTDALVVATGAAPGLRALAPELGSLFPIKGHILRGRALSLGRQVVRFRGGYVCATADGGVVGATMEVGRDDTIIDPEQVVALRSAAVRYVPSIADGVFEAACAVRAATSRGLPMVGRSVTPGVWLAVGARRNGWLLAPLMAEALVTAMAGGDERAEFAPGNTL